MCVDLHDSHVPVGDYKNIAATFRVSQLYGRTIGSYEYTLLSSLASHEVWGLEGFWLQATDALLSRVRVCACVCA